MGSTPYRVLLDALGPSARRETGLPELDHAPDPWESSMQATCECLSWRGTLDNLERRHAEDALRARVDAVRARLTREGGLRVCSPAPSVLRGHPGGSRAASRDTTDSRGPTRPSHRTGSARSPRGVRS